MDIEDLSGRCPIQKGEKISPLLPRWFFILFSLTQIVLSLICCFWRDQRTETRLESRFHEGGKQKNRREIQWFRLLLNFDIKPPLSSHHHHPFRSFFFSARQDLGNKSVGLFSILGNAPGNFSDHSFFLPSFNRFALNSIKTLISPLFKRMQKRKHIWYSIISLLFFILFFLLRTRTHFLGDGYQILSNVESNELAIKWTEPLESLLHLEAFHLAKSLFHLDAETLYALLSCMAGSIFIFLSFLFADLLVHMHFGGKEERSPLRISPRAGKILVFLLLISTGSVQLFFGYVEHYTFLFLSMFGFIFLSLVYLAENPAFGGEGTSNNYSRTKLIFPLLAFVLTFLFHVSALYLLPSVFFLSLAKDQKSKLHRTKRFLLGIFALILVVIILWGYKRYSWSVPPLFVPLIHDRYSAPGYTLFSLPHLSDFLNQQLLVSPVGLILILAFLICLVVSLPNLKKRRSFFVSRTSQFLLILSLSQLLFDFLMDPALGASRDWDLFSAVGMGYTILGLYLLLKFFKDKIKFEYLSVILVVTSLYSTVPWIALNSSESKTIARFRNLLLIDPKKSSNGHFVLFKYFETRGKEEEAEKQNEVQRELLPELPLMAEGEKFLVERELDSAETRFLLAKEIAPRLPAVHHHLGMVYLAKGGLNKAEIEFREAIKLAPFVPGAYISLANLYVVKGDTNDALDIYKKAIFLKWPDPEPYYNVGLIYFRKGDLDKAEDFFKKTLRLKPDFVDAYVGLGNIYKEKEKFQEAIKMYQAALRLDPDLAVVHLRLGMIYVKTNSKEDAIRELERFIELAPQSKNTEEVRNILQELRQ
jgi:tetratricopeptide (TPR) repeat protein